jgi:4-hydroxy-tetrahydrodipicolinate reductase
MTTPAAPIQIIISGHGKMGQEVEKMVRSTPHFHLQKITQTTDELSAALDEYKPDLVIDFSTPDSAYPNAKTIIEHNTHPVIGTTGFNSDDIRLLQESARAKKLGGIIAPNFSIGAVLMMKFAAAAAKYLNQVEIVEKHHQSKLDAPSGTALKTAELIAKQREHAPVPPHCHESLPGALGAHYQNIPIHSVRLPGFVSNQDVIFSEPGETLTITHNTTSREAYMPGIRFACEKVFSLNELVYGLEHLL